VVVNGIDVDEIQRAVDPRSVARQALGLSPTALALGCIARFDKRKGLPVILDAVQRLTTRYPEVALVLIGSGATENALRDGARQAGIAEKVRFAGPIVDAHRMLPALDLYVSASQGEGLPLTVLEAMASGLPVVATRVTGHVDVVVDGVTGFLTRPEDPADFAAAVARLLDDPEQRRKMGRAGQERVHVEFGADRMAAETAALFREALNDTSTSSRSPRGLRI
jgi:glycosyltransferase involved in cell wall biosynthesis